MYGKTIMLLWVHRDDDDGGGGDENDDDAAAECWCASIVNVKYDVSLQGWRYNFNLNVES